MLPPLVDAQTFAAALDDDSVLDKEMRATFLLSGASALVRKAARLTWIVDGEPTAVPDEVVTIVCQVAARAWKNPGMLESDQAGPFNPRWGNRGPEGLYLTDDEEQVLAALNPASRPGLWTQGVTRDDLSDPTVWQPYQGTEEPFPWWQGDPA